MVEHAPQLKTDEQYPLLKVVSGDGDSTGRQSHTVVPPGWNVSCSPKRPRFDRWRELVAACWKNCILLGISFLVMYLLAMGAIRRNPVLILKCNDSKVAGNVFYHQIVQVGNYVPFLFYSKYLASMAVQYPLLNFNIFFLTDDSAHNTVHRSKRGKLFSRLVPYYSREYFTNLDEANVLEYIDFQRRYQNVNITIVPLSKFMALTPLRYKWRTIPISYLPFYARIFAVWQSGGVGIDLELFNNKFNSRQSIDRRIAAILQQHNDGIKPEEYTMALKNIEKEEENDFLSKLFGLANQVLNETRMFFNKSFSFTQLSTDKDLSWNDPLARTHRNKRNAPHMQTIKNDIDSINNIEPVKLALVNTSSEMITNDTSQTSAGSVASLNNTKTMNIKQMLSVENTKTTIPDKFINSNESGYKLVINESDNKFGKKAENVSEFSKIIVFYDFSFLSDGIGPYYTLPEQLQTNVDQSTYVKINNENAVKRNKSHYILSIDSEGLFVAASSRFHPFLGQLLSSGCQRMPPKIAIQDVMFTQCAIFFKDDIYCNNIYVL